MGFKFINKQEAKYILFSSIFAIIFFVILLPLILPSIDGINPFIQFIIFNVLIFILLQIFLKSITTKKKFNLGYGFGIVILFMAIDILVPPLSISISGEFASNVTLIQSSSDYIFGLIWNNLGIGGFALFIFTYVITPIILFIISSILLKNFVSEI